MKVSRRALRMQRHYARMHKTGGLNLVSLMDIFTILVFFLMVNSSDVKVLQQDKSVQLPVSVADQEPKDDMVITVAGNSILVLGRAVAAIDEQKNLVVLVERKRNGVNGRFEKRGEIIRLVKTLRGGDRPKNAHGEFAHVTVMPRSGWEPWGVFRKPCEGRVQDNLRKWKTGGFRRPSPDKPFGDVIESSHTGRQERSIAPHPTLKPQAFLRQLVRAALPLGEGVILDPFAGAGSTLAAAEAVGYESIGIEKDKDYFSLACSALPRLAALCVKSG